MGQLEGSLACRLCNAVLRIVPNTANLRALQQMARAEI